MAIGIAIGIGFRQLIATIAAIVATFKARVLADGGTSEATQCLTQTVTRLLAIDLNP